jgi:hypothetical protein
MKQRNTNCDVVLAYNSLRRSKTFIICTLQKCIPELWQHPRLACLGLLPTKNQPIKTPKDGVKRWRDTSFLSRLHCAWVWNALLEMVLGPLNIDGMCLPYGHFVVAEGSDFSKYGLLLPAARASVQQYSKWLKVIGSSPKLSRRC